MVYNNNNNVNINQNICVHPVTCLQKDSNIFAHIYTELQLFDD